MVIGVYPAHSVGREASDKLRENGNSNAVSNGDRSTYRYWRACNDVNSTLDELCYNLALKALCQKSLTQFDRYVS